MSKLIDKVYTKDDYLMQDDMEDMKSAYDNLYDKINNTAFVSRTKFFPSSYADAEDIYYNLKLVTGQTVLAKSYFQQYDVAIEKIGIKFYKPDGWIEYKNIISFSYNDLNRWINNLNLLNDIDYDNLANMNIWCYIYNNLEWNTEESNLEWEE